MLFDLSQEIQLDDIVWLTKSKILFKKKSFFFFFLKESAGGDLQSPLTPESINGTDDERTPDVTQNSEPRTEPAQNALPFSHRYTFNSAIMIK